MSRETQELYYDIRIPDTGDDFEKLIQKVCSHIYGAHFARYGHNGQEQNGIDLYSPNFHICVQCKNYQGYNAVQRLRNSMKQDFLSAIQKFHDHIQEYVLATTVRRDTHIQDLFAELSRQYPHVKIQILFWDDIKDILQQTPDLINVFHQISPEDQRYHELTHALFESLCEFRYGLKKDDLNIINTTLEHATAIVQSIYQFSLRYKLSNPDIYQKCDDLVDQFNAFLEKLRSCSHPSSQTNKTRINRSDLKEVFENLLLTVHTDNPIIKSDLDQKLTQLLELMQNALYDFGRGVTYDDASQMSLALSRIAKVVNEIYVLSARYERAYPDVYDKCSAIVHQYKIFYRQLDVYVHDPEDTNTPHSENLRAELYEKYSDLHELVLTYLK